ncbi:MAG TPA: DinB family protein [Candidatus Limnocylindrales bacterium]|jgi:hypothetical protein|nr:DinB family protein [Candidatus Limnocylindrales bacterium]
MSDVIAQCLSMFRTSVDRWSAISRADPALLAREPQPGEWSAIQALQHAVDTELTVFHARIIAIRDGGGPFPGYDPATQGHVDRITSTPAELVAQFAERRAQSLAAIETLTPDDLSRTGIHAELGTVTMDQLLNQWAAHDTMHIVQAERALMQPFIPASGPWRGYFADHDVDLPATR